MPKTSVKRKVDAVTFDEDDGGDDDDGSSDNGAADAEEDGDVYSNENGSAYVAETPAPKTPQKQKTPGSLPGMSMRSGRKKKRSASAVVGEATPLRSGVTPLRKRPKKGAAPEEGEGMVLNENGKINWQWTKKRGDGTEVMDEDKKYIKGENGMKADNDKSEDEEMVDEEEGGQSTEKGGTVRKVPPETTRAAVAAAQVTEFNVEREGGGGEEGETAAAAANSEGTPAPANGGGRGGVLRLVGQMLRLPSQNTPRPLPLPTVTSASAIAVSPVPPPGGRRLIFETAKKSHDGSTKGTRNKLLMETRKQQQQVEKVLDHTPNQSQYFQQNATDGITAAGVAKTFGRLAAVSNTETPLPPSSQLSNPKEEAIKRDVVLYAKGWFLILFTCFAIGNAVDILTNYGGSIRAECRICRGALLRMWSLRASSAKWREWYGIEPSCVTATINNASADSIGAEGGTFDGGEGDEETMSEDSIMPEAVIETVFLTDPKLLSAARTALRAERLNLHHISELEQSMEELESALGILDDGMERWRDVYPDFDVATGERRSEVVGANRSGDEGAGFVVVDDTMKKMVIQEIVSDDVVIFSNSYCSYCKMTKELFRTMREESERKKDTKAFHTSVVELDNLPNGLEIQATLLQMTGQRTVPNVFVRGRHVGGNDDVQEAAKSGQLEEMLRLEMYQTPFELSSVLDAKKDEEKKISYDEIEEMKSGLAERHSLLLKWEWALEGAEEAVDLLHRGLLRPDDLNKAIDALSEVSMMPAKAMVLDMNEIVVPGEACGGVNYVLPNLKEEAAREELMEEEEDGEEEITKVGGGIDMNALNFASDTPVRPEDARSAYESLLKLAHATAESLVGETMGPSSHAQRWVKQVIQEELQKKEADNEPPSINEAHKPVVTLEMMAATFTGVPPTHDTYKALDAVRDIDRLLEIEDADRTGKLDYASVRHGARVLRRGPHATSYSLYETLPLLHRVLAYTNLRFYGHPPEAALLPSTTLYGRGGCWSFPNEFLSMRSRRPADVTGIDIRGEYATLTVSLARATHVMEVVIEHLPVSVSHDPTTAIHQFRVVGFEDGGAYGEPWELGLFNFKTGPTMQAFPVPTILDGQGVPRLSAISIMVDSNHGGEYSCLYRVRVHGA